MIPSSQADSAAAPLLQQDILRSIIAETLTRWKSVCFTSPEESAERQNHPTHAIGEGRSSTLPTTIKKENVCLEI